MSDSVEEIVGTLSLNNQFTLDLTQLEAWRKRIEHLKSVLAGREGRIYFVYSIPRMGRRIDNVVLIGDVVFVLEFKVGESGVAASAGAGVGLRAGPEILSRDESGRSCRSDTPLCTVAPRPERLIARTVHDDGLLVPIKSDVESLRETFETAPQCDWR